tara:strand:- start:2078 stop:3313 length:1236 start_codon:yes stop_codon:yes gene_type:complete
MKKLILVESEMKFPKGHFLDNLIESTYTFKNKFKIFWFLNKKFQQQGTFVPKEANILKVIESNFFKRKENKVLYILEEIIIFIINFYYLFYYSFVFRKVFKKYFFALRSNFFLLPKYFKSFYPNYKSLNLISTDHILFQTSRRKDIALVNFLTKLDENHPIFHLRLMMPPTDRFKGFYYYLKQIDKELIKKKIYIYVWSDHNKKLLIKNTLSKKGIEQSSIPWSFQKKNYKSKNYTIGFIGDARKSRGFDLLIRLIEKLEKNKSKFNYIVQFSKIDADMIKMKKKLYEMSKKTNRLKIVEKYCDYREFRQILNKIDIMPIMHKAKEINRVTSGTMYSCLINEIPMVIPNGVTFMTKLLRFRSFEFAKNIDDFQKKLIKISKNYKFYLNQAKKNSSILKKKLTKDPLIKNIR